MPRLESRKSIVKTVLMNNINVKIPCGGDRSNDIIRKYASDASEITVEWNPRSCI